MKKYIRSDYIEANIATQLHGMPKERLESVLSQIASITRNDTVSQSDKVHRIKYLLSKYNLH